MKPLKTTVRPSIPLNMKPKPLYNLPSNSINPTIELKLTNDNKIPKIIHIVWIGDESKKPSNCINTWVEKNPTWTIKVWGNDDINNIKWINRKHMQNMPHLYGKTDLMRWELLYFQGGFAIDADCECLHPLPDEWLDYEVFSCWDIDAPNLPACGYVACKPGNILIKHIIDDIYEEPSIDSFAVHSVGSYKMADVIAKYDYKDIHMFPGHYFIPEHHNGFKYTGDDTVYARQYWGSTTGSYSYLNTKELK